MTSGELIPMRSPEVWLDTPPQEKISENKNPQVIEGSFLAGLEREISHDPIPFETMRGTARIAQAGVRYRHRIPEEITRDTGVVICHGFLAKKGAYEDFADNLASRGIPSTTYEAVRSQRFLAGLHPKHAVNPARLVCQAPWGVLKELRQRDDFETPKDKFTFVGHSMGGRTAVVNAHKHSESVDGVVMIDAAGLEKHNILQLLGRIPDFAINEIAPAIDSGDITPAQARKLALNGLLYITNNPTRTIAEAISIGNADIKPAVSELKKKDIHSAIVVSANDRLLHASKATDHAAEVADIFAYMPDPELGHLGPVRRPDEYGAAVTRIVKHFDALKLKNSVPQPIVSHAEAA